MKRKTITVTEEFDEKGILKYKSTETTEEEDGGFIYPQNIELPKLEFDTKPICGVIEPFGCVCSKCKATY